MVLGFSILFTMFSVIIFSNNLAAAGGGFGDESGDPVDQDEPLPDLAITGIVLGNANGDEMIVKGDRGIIHVYVTNLGEDLVGDRFDILVEYWYHANEYREEWYFLKVVSVERTFGVQRIESSTIVWETGINDYKPGTYTFRARLLLDPSTPDGSPFLCQDPFRWIAACHCVKGKDYGYDSSNDDCTTHHFFIIRFHEDTQLRLTFSWYLNMVVRHW